jgi:plasmid stabilization system protein ParE
MKVIFSAYSRKELDDASLYLEAEREGLGDSFRDEVQTAIERIVRYPLAWAIERDDIRRCLLHRFPYKILYTIELDHIFIVAVAHQHRRPDYWVDRGTA